MRAHTVRNREVELIHIARANPLMNRSDLLSVLLFGETKFGFDHRLFFTSVKVRHPRRYAVEKRSRCVIESIALLVNAEPGQRGIQRPTGPARRQSGFRLEAVAALIRDEARSRHPRGNRAFNLAEEPGNFRR